MRGIVQIRNGDNIQFNCSAQALIDEADANTTSK